MAHRSVKINVRPVTVMRTPVHSKRISPDFPCTIPAPNLFFHAMGPILPHHIQHMFPRRAVSDRKMLKRSRTVWTVTKQRLTRRRAHTKDMLAGAHAIEAFYE